MGITTKSFPATFVRGGTSRGLIIRREHLPKDESEWQPILSSAMGSPDSSLRQLNGMGSGISSTSKICVISPSERPDADVEYTFVQVGIREGDLDMAGNCGNMSSAVGPVAFNEGIADGRAAGNEITMRMWNTNTKKIIHSTFDVQNSKFRPVGDYTIDGIPGSGSKITLSFLNPAGAKTGLALPTGNPIDILELSDGSTMKASLVDIANPGVFVTAGSLDLPGDIPPDLLAASGKTMARLEDIRRTGAMMMGLDPNIQSIPKVVIISRPATTDKGVNIVCRALSMQQPHKAVPLTLALNLGAACRIPGTLPATLAVDLEGKESVTIAHASGNIDVGSSMGDGTIKSALLHRTARVLMKGEVFYTA